MSCITLADLEPGQSAVIDGFTADSDSSVRLMQLGLIVGTPVKMLRHAPLGDPLEVRIQDYTLSLRREDAATVLLAASA